MLSSDGRRNSGKMLTEVQQQEITEEYRRGAKPKELIQRYGILRVQLYALLRKAGVALQNPERGYRKQDHSCVVCGEDRPLPPYAPNKIWMSTPCCKDEACQTIVFVRPDLRRVPAISFGGRKLKGKSGKGDRHLWDVVADVAEVVEAITCLDAAELTAVEKAYCPKADERGLDVSQVAKQSPWGRLSEVTVAVHLRSTEGATTSVLLRTRLPGEKPVDVFLRRYFGKDATDETLVDAFNILYLWRCHCPQQKVYMIRHRDYFPTEPGDYGFCSSCGAAALEIRR